MKLTGTWGFETTNPVQCFCFGHFVDAFVSLERVMTIVSGIVHTYCTSFY